MTLAAVSDDIVVAELWVSLVSLIQSYVAAHELGKRAGAAAIGEANANGGELIVSSGGRRMLIACVNGAGAWRVFDQSAGDEGAVSGNVIGEGSFHIGADSLVEFSDRKGKLELDVAAEAFTAKIFDDF
ncbi:MAG TPA: hypothetical protein VGD64_06270 [Acidisarcina sp.]